MGKDKKKSKAKATEPVELSKKDRKKLEAREAELAAKVAEAEKKASKKAKAKRDKMSKATKKGKVSSPPTESAASESGESTDRHPHLAHLDRVGELDAIVNDPTAKKKARKAAEAELAELRAEGERLNAEKAKHDAAEEYDATAESKVDPELAVLKARVEAKTKARAEGKDPEAAADKAEKKARKAQADAPRDVHAARMPDAEPGETEAEYQMRKLREKKAASAPAQVAEEVATETGREFAVGEAKAEPEVSDELDPDAAPEPAIKLTDDGKRYLITRPDGTEARYTRATTYIDGLEHTGALDAWKLRTLLEGVVINEEDVATGPGGELFTSTVRDAIHTRDVAIKKLDKADRKGKLEVGERGVAEVAIMQAFKATLDNVAEEALDLGGVHEKANKGTDLHSLTGLCDEHGIEHIKMLATAGTITPADLADIEAYDAKMRELGLKVVETETVVVDDERGVAGRLDRIVSVPGKVLGRARGAKVVADIKTGSAEYIRGKVAMQTCIYATAKGYDADNPTERRELGVLKPTSAKHPGKAPLKKDKPLKRDGEEAMAAYLKRVEDYDAALANYHAKRGVSLLIHLPQGEARCEVYIIDLNVGARGLAIVEQVREWRNFGKSAVDLKAPLSGEAVSA